MLTANFGRKFFLNVKKCKKKQYKSITQITGDFIKKIGEIFKESEKLYETEEKNQIANAKFRNKPCGALY